MLNLIQGASFIDDRGTVSFVNDFNFTNVKRFYQVSNHAPNFIRAWHGHKLEGKYVYVANGAAIVAAVPLDNMNVENCKEFILAAAQPRILYIPPGYANGFKTLVQNTIIQFFSTSSLEESKGDDYRFDFDTVNIWREKYR